MYRNPTIRRIAKQITKLQKLVKFAVKPAKVTTMIMLPVLATAMVVSLPSDKSVAKNAGTKTVTESSIKLGGDIFTGAGNGKAKIEVGESLAQAKEREQNAKSASARVATVSVASVGDEPSLEQKRAIYQQIAAEYGIDWKLLDAVHTVESNKTFGPGRISSAGAAGPCQFMPGTWRAYGVDGDGDGNADIYNPIDALHGAANYLAANGANRGDIDNALFRYNHSSAYVAKVKAIMNSI
jgi:membrane-bound lytic murein transglycosylase B